MAFKMKGSPAKMGRIHGTAAHKASIAKAKTRPEPIVAQTRTAADPSLVAAGSDLGKSYMPGEVDYTVRYQPKIGDPKKKKETQKEDDVMGCMDSTAENYNASATKDDGNCKYKEKEGQVDVDLDEYNKSAKIIKEEEKKKKNGGKVKKVVKDIATVIAAPVAIVGKVIKELGDEVADGLKDLENRIEKAKADAKTKAEARRVERELRENSKVLQKIEVQVLKQQELSLTPSTIDKTSKISKNIPADDNPKYKTKPAKTTEGQATSLGGTTMTPGYNYNPSSDNWTYNGHTIRANEVSDEAYISIMNNIKEDAQKPVVTPSSKGTDNEVTSRNKPKIKIDTSLMGTPKPSPKDYKTSRDYMRARMAWYKANPNG